jgi:2-dehydro-3-deoxyglucarate aldolase/4-hydroxy-2-oxoheptanedioate aldolase
MAEECGVPVHFRIKHTRLAYLIGNYLDLGPSGVEVPQVETVETVEEAVRSFYYPPLGMRSVGGRARCGAARFSDPFAYAEWWNGYGVTWMQVESVQAVTSAYALAREGVDCLSFGPTDLTFDLKFNPHPDLETVDDCIAHVARELQGTGTALSFRNGTPDTRARYADMGVTVFLEGPRRS